MECDQDTASVCFFFKKLKNNSTPKDAVQKKNNCHTCWLTPNTLHMSVKRTTTWSKAAHLQHLHIWWIFVLSLEGGGLYERQTIILNSEKKRNLDTDDEIKPDIQVQKTQRRRHCLRKFHKFIHRLKPLLPHSIKYFHCAPSKSVIIIK